MCANLGIFRFVLLRSLENRAVLVPDPRKYVIYNRLRVSSSCVTPVARAMTILSCLVAVVSGNWTWLSCDSFIGC